MSKQVAENFRAAGYINKWITYDWCKPYYDWCTAPDGETMKLEDLPNFNEPADEYLQVVKDIEDAFDYYNKNGYSRSWIRAVVWATRYECAATAIIQLIGNIISVCSIWAYGMILDIIRTERGDEVFSHYIIAIICLRFFFERLEGTYWWHRGARLTMYGHRTRYACRHVLYKKALCLQVGSCPSEIDEAKILRAMEETGHIHAITNHWPG